jgi:hypothetical protein
MNPMAVVFLGISVVLGGLAFMVGSTWSTHWRVLAALVPIAATFFIGFFGLFIGVFFVAALYKMSAN